MRTIPVSPRNDRREHIRRRPWQSLSQLSVNNRWHIVLGASAEPSAIVCTSMPKAAACRWLSSRAKTSAGAAVRNKGADKGFRENCRLLLASSLQFFIVEHRQKLPDFDLTGYKITRRFTQEEFDAKCVAFYNRHGHWPDT